MSVTLPYNITNGTVANADQVMANFNALNVPASTVYYDVTSYGAKGDGTTDDTASIQSAINAQYIAGGGIVFFPSGTYLVTDTLVLLDGAVLLGVNKSQVAYIYDETKASSRIKFAPTSEKDLFDITQVIAGHSGYMWRVYIGGLILQGNTAGAVTYSKYAINTKSAESVFENMGIRYFQDGIYCNATISNKYNNIRIQDCSHAGIYTSTSINTTDIFDNIWVDSCPWGAILQHAVDFRFINCLWESLTTGGVNIYRDVTAEFITNYSEDVPSTSAGTNYGMFYIGHSGASGGNEINIIGGYYGGSNTTRYGSFVDIDYLLTSDTSGVTIAPTFFTRFVNGIKVDTTNTNAYTVRVEGGFKYSSITNLFVGDTVSNTGTFRIYGALGSGPIENTFATRQLYLYDNQGHGYIDTQGFNCSLATGTSLEIDYTVGTAALILVTANDGTSIHEAGLFSIAHVGGIASVVKIVGTTNTAIISTPGNLCVYPLVSGGTGEIFIKNNLAAPVTISSFRLK